MYSKTRKYIRKDGAVSIWGRVDGVGGNGRDNKVGLQVL